MYLSSVEKCLNSIGIMADSLKPDDSLQDYIEDSMSFITFIVEIEQFFGIEVDDTYLLPDTLRTMQDVCAMIQVLKIDSDLQVYPEMAAGS